MQVCRVRIARLVLLTVLLACSLLVLPVSSAGPDIVGTRIILPSALLPGQEVEVQDSIRNQGTENAGPFSISYYLNPDTTGSLNEMKIGSWDVGGLKRGAVKTANTTLTIPDSLESGEYFFIRKIDPEQQLSGEYQSNNAQRSRQPVMIGDHTNIPLRGLRTIIPSEVQAGDSLSVSVVIENPNDFIVSPVAVQFLLSPTENADENAVILGSLESESFSEHEEMEISGTIPVPSDILPDDYFLITRLVLTDTLTEQSLSGDSWFNEDMIRITSPITDERLDLSGASGYGSNSPDIISLEAEFPFLAYIGDTFQVSDGIRNVGGAAANIVRVEYGISPDQNGKNSRHAGWWTEMNVKADQVIRKDSIVGVPSGLLPGYYYLTRKITVTSFPSEENTANNWWVSNRPIEIRYNPLEPIPDLAHIKTVWPPGQPGEKVQITDTITNIGRGCADSIAVAYYLSPYPEFNPQTAEYLGVWYPGSLCPGEQKSDQVSVTIPSSLSNGEYFIYSVIDPCFFIDGCGGGLPEHEKGNNINVGKLIIGPCPFC